MAPKGFTLRTRDSIVSRAKTGSATAVLPDATGGGCTGAGRRGTLNVRHGEDEVDANVTRRDGAAAGVHARRVPGAGITANGGAARVRARGFHGGSASRGRRRDRDAGT